MPAKKKNDDRSATPQADDPNVLAQREAQDRAHAEQRGVVDHDEMLARRRVEALEKVDFKCVQWELEKKLNPEKYREQTTHKGPYIVHVKLLTGNRAIPQNAMRISLPEGEDTSLLLLKTHIRDQALRSGHSAERYTPSGQRLFVFGREIVADDDHSSTLKQLKVHPGCTLHLALAVPPHRALPSQIPPRRATVVEATA